MAKGGINKVDISDETIKAFWAKVDVSSASECWPWNGASSPNGYGNIRINSSYMKAHRAAWIIAHFDIPAGFIVCHACDNPSCCNPGHLMLGTIRSNYVDMATKGRAQHRKNKAVGTRNTNAKLDSNKVAAIRNKYFSGEANQYELANEYCVTQSTIGAVVRNKTWRHI